MVAPRHLRTTLKQLVDREAAHARAGRPAHIVIKVNAVTDDAMIRALYRASQAGVTIDLLVRGICSLRPGVPGISERIRVRSIVGRFLEHSRIYWFANGGAEEMFIGSADVMERNLGRRVETLIPVRDERILRHLRDVVLDAYLKDTDRAMALDASGGYTPRRPPAPTAASTPRNSCCATTRATGARQSPASTTSSAETTTPRRSTPATTAPNTGKITSAATSSRAITSHERQPGRSATPAPGRRAARGRASVNSRPATTPAA